MKKIFFLLFNHKPSTYGIIYLLLIPTFAFIYAFIPTHFYNATAKFENSLITKHSDEILKTLKIEIENNYHKYYKDNVIDDKTNSQLLKNIHYESLKKIYYPSFKLFSLKYENDRFFFKLCVEGINDSNESYIVFEINNCIDFSFSQIEYLPNFNDTIENIDWTLREVRYETPFTNTDTSLIMILKKFFYKQNYGVKAVYIDDKLNDKLNQYAQTMTGFPTSFNENYWRMFYFSAVTITTVGYGDIVPITNLARILISIEAILGVVLIGLFLNSLSKRFK